MRSHGVGALKAVRRLLVPVAGLVALAVFPETLLACPVCFDRDDESRIAFLATTALLTFLPLGLVLGTTVWLRKRSKSLSESDDSGDVERFSDEG